MNPMYNLHVPKELKANVGENSIHLVHVPILISLTWICLKNAWKKWTNNSLPNGVSFHAKQIAWHNYNVKQNTLNKPIGSMGMVYLLTCPIECGHFFTFHVDKYSIHGASGKSAKNLSQTPSKPCLGWTGWSQTREWRAGPAG